MEANGKGEYGCKHYKRNCKIRAPCCGEIFPCRHCHNETKNLLNGGNGHELPRHDVQLVICSNCEQEQPVVRSCMGCGTVMGHYFCGICKFYDDDISKRQFHCSQCGICRVGGHDNFFHCKKCGCCYSNDLKNNHICIENSLRHDCAICFEEDENLWKEEDEVELPYSIIDKLRGLGYLDSEDEIQNLAQVGRKGKGKDKPKRVHHEIESTKSEVPTKQKGRQKKEENEAELPDSIIEKLRDFAYLDSEVEIQNLARVGRKGKGKNKPKQVHHEIESTKSEVPTKLKGRQKKEKDEVELLASIIEKLSDLGHLDSEDEIQNLARVGRKGKGKNKPERVHHEIESTKYEVPTKQKGRRKKEEDEVELPDSIIEKLRDLGYLDLEDEIQNLARFGRKEKGKNKPKQVHHEIDSTSPKSQQNKRADGKRSSI